MTQPDGAEAPTRTDLDAATEGGVSASRDGAEAVESYLIGSCRHWIGSDTSGRVCGKPVHRFSLCEKHFAVHLERTKKRLAKEKAQHDAAEARWRERNASKLPAWRVQLEAAEAEYARRTTSPVEDRAAYGGAMSTSVIRAQRSRLSDANVARVAELERIMKRLRADIERMERQQ